MPELPEVETIKRGLSKLIIKEKLQKIHILCAKSFQGESGKIEGASIITLRRFGKALVIDLDNQKSLLIHLRMTGQLVFDPRKSPKTAKTSAFKNSATSVDNDRFAAGHPSENFLDNLPNKQTRVILELTNGTLYFNDQRKFGFIKVLGTKEVKEDDFIKKLAREPWDISEEDFYQKLQKHPKSPIKATILDQSVICGLGNIYADETLFMSKIHPMKKSGEITKKEAREIIENAKKVMDISIASGGSTMKDYKKADGTRGNYLDKFVQVFGRQGKECPVCSTKIKKIKVAGRGTHICPNCQKEPK